jgi:hypothetical protein
MFADNPGRAFVVIATLMFLCATVLMTLIGLRIQIHDGNYAAVYVGFGVWLECLFLTVHFFLRAVLQSRPSLVDTVSRVLAAIILLPIGLIVLIQIVLIEQSIHFGDRSVDTLVATTLIFLLLVIPGVFMFRFVLGAAFRRRAQQPIEAACQ